MIAFGASINMPEIYKRCARPGIDLVAEPDSQVLEHAAAGSIPRAYNLILERAAALGDLEALVLLHQDAEITDPDFCAKLRFVLSDPDVGVVGCVGAAGVDGIAWWEGPQVWASSVFRYGELGGGELSTVAWHGEQSPPPADGQVDTVAGLLLALSPWTVRNVRFDESLGLVNGYDFDLCRQVRAAGRKVVWADLKVAHHHSLDLVTDRETWMGAHMRAAEKWDDGGAEEDWKQRARRAEAEAAAAQLVVASKQYQADARTKEHERRLQEVAESMSWRVTAPLRRLNTMRETSRQRGGPGPVRRRRG